MISSSTDNGIRYAVRSYGNAVAYCALSIKVGTRDEQGYHSGIAHFMEHTLFKGTQHKSASVINSYLERLGGELNAFTTKEEIVLHATTLKQDMAKAVSLLLEIAFEATFPEDEIEVEKGVVIDEIASYKDSPSEDIYDNFEEKLFAGTPLEGQILGTEESVKAISSKELQEFRNRFFTPDRMCLTVVSPLSEDKMDGIVCRCCAKYGDIPAGNAPARILATAQAPAFNTVEDKDNHQVNCIWGALAPNAYGEQDRLATILLCNILGGPASNSILDSILRERNGWVYNVECSYTPYSDNGIAAIIFGCDKENLASCERVIRRELHRLQQTPLSEARLKAAKRQLLGQNAIAMENGEAQCISMGKSLLSYGHIQPTSEIEAKLAAITAAKLQEMAVRIFSDDKLCRMVYL